MAGEAGHAGDITPEDAIALIESRPETVLIDVRTPGEWDAVGVPDTAGVGSAPILLEWALPPTMSPNPEFVPQLEAALRERGADARTPLLFLCRSGARSAAAARAMTARGYGQAYNIAGGFEGSPPQGMPGWKAAGHPWSHR